MIVGGMKFRGDRRRKNKKDSSGASSKKSHGSKPSSSTVQQPSLPKPTSNDNTATYNLNKPAVNNISYSNDTTENVTQNRKHMYVDDDSDDEGFDKYAMNPDPVSPDDVKLVPTLGYGKHNKIIEKRAPRVEMEAADDEFDGVELISDDRRDVIEKEQHVMTNQMTAEQREYYKNQWNSSPKKKKRDDDSGSLSDASSIGAVNFSGVSQSAVRTVSKILVDDHLPPEIVAEDAKNKHLLISPNRRKSNDDDEHNSGENSSTDKNTEKEKFGNIPGLIEPNEQISELLSNITQTKNLTMRKNAIGALKVLAAKDANKRTLAWTAGVLPAIISVLTDRGGICLWDKPQVSSYKEARDRATTTLLNLSSHVKNKSLMVDFPGLLDSMISTMQEDKEESRQTLCACILNLSKHAENRPKMVFDSLISTMMDIIAVRAGKEKLKNETNDDTLSVSSSSSAGSQDSGGNAKLRKVVSSTPTDDDSVHNSASTASRTNDCYDKVDNPFLSASRIHVFATCLTLSKDKKVSHTLAHSLTFMSTILEVANRFDSPAHTHCIAILAQLTRCWSNLNHMVYRVKHVVPTLTRATNSQDAECRKFACYALENLSCERSCRHEICSVPNLIPSLCCCCNNTGFVDEQLAAISVLRSLSDDPANLINMANSPGLMSTLEKMAMISLKEDEEDEKMQMMNFYACDTMATLSFWLGTLSSKVMGVKRESGKLYVPSMKTTSYEQWQ